MLQQTNNSNKLRADYAIMTRIKYEEKLNKAEDYDRKLKFIGVNTNWFESQQKYEVKKIKKLNDNKIMKELILTNQEIKLRRKERLLELYSIESYQYEEELSRLGLAIVKERY